MSKLELDARTPLSHFGRRIKKSQQQISYTVGSLLKKGIIQNFYTLMDYSKLNILLFRVYFKVNYVNEKKLEELIDHLVKNGYTSWVCSCGGRYDLISTFFAYNPSQFNKVLHSIMEKFPEQIDSYSVLTTVVRRRFGRKYLFKNYSTIQQIILGGDRKPASLDDIDLKILDELSEDARKNSVIIGNKLGISPKTVISRIRKLKDTKVIMGFKPSFDLSSIGYHSRMMVLKYYRLSKDAEDNLINYLKTHPNILSLIKTLGEWDIEIEVEAQNDKDMRKIEIELRQRFPLLIRQIENIPLYKTYKITYFPKFLLKEEK